MTIFEGEENQQDLIYDNTAFMHYLVSVFSILGFVMMILIIRDTKKWFKPDFILKAQKEKDLKNKAEFTWELLRKKRRANAIGWKLLGFAACIAVVCLCLNQTEGQRQLVGFDPYEILGLNIGAKNAQIKKAYHKLALKQHPDRKRHKQSSNKFILISKAYKCLTDETTKQNCLKYGNPDGQVYQKIGIGLPSFMLQKEYSSFIAFGLLFVLLFVVPTAFIRWISNTELSKTKKGEYMDKNSIISSLMTPKLNQIDCCIILALSPQIQALLPLKCSSSNQDLQIERQILRKSNLAQDQIQSMKRQTLYRFKYVYEFLFNKGSQSVLTVQIPNLIRQCIQFSFCFAKRSLSGRFSKQNFYIQWFGLLPCRQTIQFSRRMLNRSLLQQKIPQNAEILPQICLHTAIKLEKKQVSEITIDDIIKVSVNIKKTNKALGFVINPNYPGLIQEQFLLLISNNSNLLSSLFFTFSQKSQIVHDFSLKKLPIGIYNMSVAVYSLSYFGLDVTQTKIIQVFQKFQKNQIIVHEEDKKIEKIPKNFFESLIDFKIGNQSDLQLSDSQSQGQLPQKKKRKAKRPERMIKQVEKSEQMLQNTAQQS